MLDISYKSFINKTNKGKKDNLGLSNDLRRFKQPIVIRKQLVTSKKLNKIEKAKNDLIQWIIDCKIKKYSR